MPVPSNWYLWFVLQLHVNMVEMHPTFACACEWPPPSPTPNFNGIGVRTEVVSCREAFSSYFHGENDSKWMECPNAPKFCMRSSVPHCSVSKKKWCVSWLCEREHLVLARPPKLIPEVCTATTYQHGRNTPNFFMRVWVTPTVSHAKFQRNRSTNGSYVMSGDLFSFFWRRKW